MISQPAASQFLAALAADPSSGTALRKKAMRMLDQLPGYNWSGVYRLEGDTLVLDEFVGATTDHTRIKVGVGVCGTAVAENRNQVIADVRDIKNYLSCSAHTRSELVVLIRRGDEIIGQIDIDGHEVGTFDQTDEQFLTRVGAILAERWD